MHSFVIRRYYLEEVNPNILVKAGVCVDATERSSGKSFKFTSICSVSSDRSYKLRPSAVNESAEVSELADLVKLA